MRWILIGAACACCAQTVGTVPKPKAADYEVHAQAGATGLGAEYMVHSFSAGEQMYLAGDYLVVEVALYPPKGKSVEVHTSEFTLRVNGKRPLGTATPQSVAATLTRPEWRQGPRLEGEAGVGDIGVILGRPVPSRVPGGPPVTGNPPPRAPDSNPGLEKPEPEKAEDILLKTALPDGEFDGPVSGFLYFPYKGRTSSVKSVELLCYGLTLNLK